MGEGIRVKGAIKRPSKRRIENMRKILICDLIDRLTKNGWTVSNETASHIWMIRNGRRIGIGLGKIIG